MWHELNSLLDRAPGAYSVCVWDAAGQQIYAYSEQVVRSAASLIKVPLVMAVLDAVAEGSVLCSLNTQLTLVEADRVEGPGGFDTAPAGTTKTVRQLIGHALRESDNTASNLLIDVVGFARVNHWLQARELRARLRRKFMDFDALAAGRDNITTARDMCAMLYQLQQPQYASLLEDLRSAVGDRKLEAGLPPNVSIAHKVGDLPGVEHDAGIVFGPHGAYIVAALGVDLPDVETGRRTIAAVSRMIWENDGK
jgi:beta-lactamase class A